MDTLQCQFQLHQQSFDLTSCLELRRLKSKVLSGTQSQSHVKCYERTTRLKGSKQIQYLQQDPISFKGSTIMEGFVTPGQAESQYSQV